MDSNLESWAAAICVAVFAITCGMSSSASAQMNGYGNVRSNPHATLLTPQPKPSAGRRLPAATPPPRRSARVAVPYQPSATRLPQQTQRLPYPNRGPANPQALRRHIVVQEPTGVKTFMSARTVGSRVYFVAQNDDLLGAGMDDALGDDLDVDDYAGLGDDDMSDPLGRDLDIVGGYDDDDYGDDYDDMDADLDDLGTDDLDLEMLEDEDDDAEAKRSSTPSQLDDGATSMATNAYVPPTNPSIGFQQNDCSCLIRPGGYPCVGGCKTCMRGVDCRCGPCGGEAQWSDMRPMNFGAYAHGGYAGPSRLPHLSQYRLRPGDSLQMFYLITRRQTVGEYRLMVGDEVMIEAAVDDEKELTQGSLLNGLQIQPDGTITVKLVGQVKAAGMTVRQLRDLLSQKYERFLKKPVIDVTPVKTNTFAEDIRNAVGGQSGFNQQSIIVNVTPDGKIRLPKIGEVCAHGLTLTELKRELNLRYHQSGAVGLEVEPLLDTQAEHFVYVLGEVGAPQRIQITTPTTVMGAIATAGGHTAEANLRQVVVFRRADDWRLISTMLDLHGAILGRRPSPADEIWLQD
ncbi:MAG: polysaccharide biosynthesis/export family protein, partial [Planctomycetota bacterium]